jgi:hypothetical protein
LLATAILAGIVLAGVIRMVTPPIGIRENGRCSNLAGCTTEDERYEQG